MSSSWGKWERKKGSSPCKGSRFQPPWLPEPGGVCTDQQGRREEASPGWKSSDPQVRGVPPVCNCPFQGGSSTGHQTSPRGAAPRPGRCCPAQGLNYTLRQSKGSRDLYGRGAGGWGVPDLSGPSPFLRHSTTPSSRTYSSSVPMHGPFRGWRDQTYPTDNEVQWH